MASRQNAFQRQNQGISANDDSFSNAKRQKLDSGPSRMPVQPVNSPSQSTLYLNPQQVQIMNYLQQNQV